MYHFRKSVSILLSLIMVLSVFTIIPFSSASAANADVAATGETVMFATSKWVEGMEEEEGIFAFEQETYRNGLYDNFIFCRVNPAMDPTADSWGAVWNQTDDLSRNGVDERDNCYTFDHYYHKDNTHDGDYWMWGNWGQYNGMLDDAIYVRAEGDFADAQIWAYTWGEIELTKMEAVDPGYNTEAGECYEGNIEYYVSEDKRYFVRNENDPDVYDEVAYENVILPKHRLTEHPAVAAACDVPGNNAYYECELCHKFFSDERGDNEIENGDWVITVPHTLDHIPAVEATCTQNGNTEYYHCTTCNKYFSDAEGTNEIAENSWVTTVGHSWEVTWPTNPQPWSGISFWTVANVIFTCKNCGTKGVSQGNALKTDTTEVEADCTTAGYKSALFRAIYDNTLSEKTIVWDQRSALGHFLTEHPATEATISTDGNTPYWSCSRCNKFFSDAAGEHEIEENSWVIPLTGVAKYHDIYTDSLREAIVNTQDDFDTITLLKDLTFEYDADLITGGKTKFKLDKNGHTLNITVPDGYTVSESEPDDDGAVIYSIEDVPATVTYLDENGVEQQVTAYPLTFNTNRLNDEGSTNGWYYTVGNVTINGDVELYDDIKIILTNASVLTVNGTLKNNANDVNLTVYRQSGNTEGVLNVDKINAQSFTVIGGEIHVNHSIITANDINIHDGRILVNDNNANPENAVTSNNGNITITGGYNTIKGHTCLLATEGTITIAGGDTILWGIGSGMYGNYVVITGGKLNATASNPVDQGIKSYNGISLSWTNEDDYIFSDGFWVLNDDEGVTLVKAFKDQNEVVYMPGKAEPDRLATKGLKPAEFFTGHSLSLGGDIAVNFYLNLSDDEIENGATVDFAWNVEGNTKTHSVTLTAADKTDNGYKATCPIAVAEMTYEITATLKLSDKTAATDTYSAVQYADTILTDDSFKTSYIAQNGQTQYNSLTKLVKTMLSYGARAQEQFDRDIGNLADKKLTPADFESPYYYDPETVTVEMISANGSDMYAGLESFGLEYKGSTIVYLTETSIRHYYKITDQTAFDAIKGNITFNGAAVDYTKRNGEIYFELKNVAAPDLDSPYILSINGTEYSYSVMDYAKACLLSDKVSDSTKALVAATYLYNQAANTYFGR